LNAEKVTKILTNRRDGALPRIYNSNINFTNKIIHLIKNLCTVNNLQKQPQSGCGGDHFKETQ
jgi:hypothetical protein